MSNIIFVTGMSGSGKSVALHALEDSGYYCVDNLPPDLVLAMIDLEHEYAQRDGGDTALKLAIAIDVRSAKSLPLFPSILSGLRSRGHSFKLLFLDTNTDALLHRYSETRRLHPLSLQGINRQSDKSEQRLALVEAIELERSLLAAIREQAYVIDTSLIKSTQLQVAVKSFITPQGMPLGAALADKPNLTLVFQSFGFKHGVPMDADYVFDVRMLPNPHYEPQLKALNGRDAPVIAFLEGIPEVAQMLSQITVFLSVWLPYLNQDHRSYVTVAIGCTGGQHRSVYFVEKLKDYFSPEWNTLVRHREMDAKSAPLLSR